MESNIEIVIKSDGKKVMMQCHGKGTSKEKTMYAMQEAYLALVVSLLKKELLDVMEGRSCEVHTQTFKGKDAAFMAELMKRQGEVQD